MFQGCPLTQVVLPAEVTTIGSNAFNGCKSLAKVSFGTKLKTIGSAAFSGCSALTALIFPGILNTDPARPWIGIAGGIAAALLAWRRCPVLVCVLAAIGVDFVLYSFLP